MSVGYFRRTINRDLIATPCFIIYYIPLVAVVLRQEDQYESIGILLFPFDRTTWFLLIISCGIFTIINGFQTKAYKVNSFQILEVLIGMATSRVPKGTPRRIRFVIWVLCAFILRSVYQSLLFYLYRTHFYKSPPITLDGLAAAGYKTVCTQFSSDFVLYVPQIIDQTLPLIILNSSNELDPLRYLERHPDANVIAMTVMDFVTYYVATEMDYRNALQILPINVNVQQIVFYFAKHSYLNQRINEYILRFQEAGFLEMWRDWTNYDYRVTRRDGDASIYDQELMVNLKQLNGFFFVIIFLHLIAIVVFVLEMLSTRYKWLNEFCFKWV